jgi:hypothetical protein
MAQLARPDSCGSIPAVAKECLWIEISIQTSILIEEKGAYSHEWIALLRQFQAGVGGLLPLVFGNSGRQSHCLRA